MIIEEKKGNRKYQIMSNLLNMKQNYEGKMMSYASLGNHWKLSERILIRRMYRSSDEKVDHLKYFDVPEVGVISCVWNQSLKVTEKCKQNLIGCIKFKEKIAVNQDLVHSLENNLIQLSFLNEKMLMNRNQCVNIFALNNNLNGARRRLFYDLAKVLDEKLIMISKATLLDMENFANYLRRREDILLLRGTKQKVLDKESFHECSH
jgi:hypothetical protein